MPGLPPLPKNQLAGPRYNNIINQLENNYKRPPARPPGLPTIPKFFRTPIPGGGVGLLTGFFLAIDAIFPSPTVNDDEILRRIQPPPKKIQEGKYEFTGGQGNEVRYIVDVRSYSTTGYRQGYDDHIFVVYGPIRSIKVVDISNEVVKTYGLNVNCKGPGSYGQPIRPQGEYRMVGFSDATYNGWKGVEVIKIERLDGQPDIDGNPPPTQPPIYTQPPPINYPDYRLERNKGDRLLPPAYEYKIPDKPPFTFPSGLPTNKDNYDNLPNFNPTSNPTTNPPNPNLQPPTPTPTNIPTPNPSAVPTAPPVFIGNPPDIAPFAPIPNFFEPTALKPTTLTPNPIIPRTNNQPIKPDVRTGEPKPVEPSTPEKKPEKPPEKTDTQKILDKLDALKPDNPIETGIQLVGIKAVVDAIAGNTTPQKLENAAAAGTCRTTQAGGCTSNLINDAVGNINGNTNSRIDGLGLGNAAANVEQLRRLDTITERLGPQITGGLSGAFGRLDSFLGISRILNVLNTAILLHNAFMLSSALKDTLLAMISNVGKATGLLQSPEGNPLDLNAVFNQNVEGFLKSVVGDDNYDNLKSTFNKANRIYQAGANMVSQVQGMMNSMQAIAEVGAERIGKVGNALKRFGVIGENAYNWMSENLNTRTAWLDRLESRISQTNEVISGVDSIASNVISVQDSVKQFKEERENFNKALAEVAPNAPASNKPVEDKNNTDKTNSQSPAITESDTRKADA